jgi:hypothetical protein
MVKTELTRTELSGAHCKLKDMILTNRLFLILETYHEVGDTMDAVAHKAL